MAGSTFAAQQFASAAEVSGSSNGAQELGGTVFNLVREELPVNFTGKIRMGLAINGSIPAPTLRWREGDEVTIDVTNKLSERTSVHWHGILLPYQMDGVPAISFNGIAPGETFQYRFKVRQSGTYWYHSHSGLQEIRGMYGAIIVEPREEDVISADRDHVILLSEWTDEDPMYVFSRLKTLGHLSAVYNLFNLGRHLMSPENYRYFRLRAFAS